MNPFTMFIFKFAVQIFVGSRCACAANHYVVEKMSEWVSECVLSSAIVDLRKMTERTYYFRKISSVVFMFEEADIRS